MGVSITDRLQVHLGGKLLGVGPFEIAGLGDMHILSVEGSPARLVLVIGGGDGASSYNARLIFGRTHVVERTLYAGFDPAHPFEVTHYFYQTIP